MSNKKYITLTDAQRKELKELQSKGTLKARTLKRILALLELDKGQTQSAVAKLINQSVLKCIYDEQRPGRPIDITAEQRDKITLLACEDAPEGHSQWSLRLLADKVIELGYCEHISHTQVKNILSKKNSNRT